MIISVTQVQQEMAEIEKRRRRKHDQGQREHAEHAERESGGAATLGTHDVAEGFRRGMEGEAADKAIAADPARPPMPPEAVTPGRFRRPYDAAGHAAESPQADPPNVSPIPTLPAGVPVPIALPGAPLAGRVHPLVAAAYTMTSPSDRAGR